MTWEQMMQEELDYIALGTSLPRGWSKLQQERIKASFNRIRLFGRAEAIKEAIEKLRGGAL